MPTNDKLPEKKLTWDLGKAIELRLSRGLTYQEIADKLGVGRTTVYDKVRRVLGLLDAPNLNKAYEKTRVETLGAVERVMIGQLADPDKLEKASLNNVAYAFQQVHNARRLESNLATEHIDIHGQYEAHVRRRDQQAGAVSAIEQRLAELAGGKE